MQAATQRVASFLFLARTVYDGLLAAVQVAHAAHDVAHHADEQRGGQVGRRVEQQVPQRSPGHVLKNEQRVGLLGGSKHGDDVRMTEAHHEANLAFEDVGQPRARQPLAGACA